MPRVPSVPLLISFVVIFCLQFYRQLKAESPCPTHILLTGFTYSRQITFTIDSSYLSPDPSSLAVRMITCTSFQMIQLSISGAFQWVYDVKTDEWSKSETLAYIGEKLILGKKAGACRDAFNIEFLEQDDPLRKYGL